MMCAAAGLGVLSVFLDIVKSVERLAEGCGG